MDAKALQGMSLTHVYSSCNACNAGTQAASPCEYSIGCIRTVTVDGQVFYERLNGLDHRKYIQ